jgi:hypothetical protein
MQVFCPLAGHPEPTVQPNNPNWMMRFSFEAVNGKPGFYKRISDTPRPIVVTVGGGVNRTLYGYAGFVDGFGCQVGI